LNEDPVWYSWSAATLAECAETSILAVNPVIYAEVSVGFARIEDVEKALPAGAFARPAIPWEAAFLAGASFLKYRRAGGDKRAPLPDFFIRTPSNVRDHDGSIGARPRRRNRRQR
jgi:hypothetical protein